MVSLDRLGRIAAWNESIGRVTGFASAELLGQPYSIFYPPGTSTQEHLLDRLHEADENGWSLDEGLRMRADGSHFLGRAMISPLRDNDQSLDAGDGSRLRDPAYSLIMRDISGRREASERRHQATLCDYLTGLANRRAFFEAAEVELKRRKQSTRPTAMILFGADHFKVLNERFGHPVGDAVLRHLAAALSATFRNVDVVARVGGDEFAVLLPSTDLADAVALANRLRTRLETASVVVDGEPTGEPNGEPILYTVSAGVAAMDDSPDGLDGLMKRADQALHAAKAGGRNRVDCSMPDCPTYKRI